jgi:hypothetical protein
MTDEKKFRTEIPNIIDDLGLDPHERALYVHYKRACGSGNCEWIESVRITAQKTKMSIGQTSQARNRLVERGLICTIRKGNDGTAVRIVNIWDLNTAYYSQEHRPDIDGWTIEQLREWYTGVHNMNTLPDKPSNSEHLEPGVHIMNGSVHNMNNKKEPIKNILPKGNSGEAPQPATKGPKTVVKDTFLEYSKLPWPGLKKKQTFWWSQFGEIARIFNNDSDTAVKAIKSVIGYMRQQNLSIVGPQSIVNLCGQIAGGQPLVANGRDSPGEVYGGKVTLPETSGNAEEGFRF